MAEKNTTLVEFPLSFCIYMKMHTNVVFHSFNGVTKTGITVHNDVGRMSEGFYEFRLVCRECGQTEMKNVLTRTEETIVLSFRCQSCNHSVIFK